VPATVGVPLTVYTPAAHDPVSPAGNVVEVAPVAPVVANVKFAIGVLIQTVCDSVPDAELKLIVFRGVTFIVIGTLKVSGVQ
jgi:hypothetical protein